MSEMLMSETRVLHGIVFNVEVRSSDEMPDISFLGEFTDLRADEHGCGKRHVRNTSGNFGSYEFFCPSFGCDSRGWKEIAAENGWTKDEWFAAAQRDMELALNWWDCWVSVTADLGPLGEASSSLGGLDWMTDESYITKDIVDDLVAEAEAEAEAILYRRFLGGRSYHGWEVPA